MNMYEFLVTAFNNPLINITVLCGLTFMIAGYLMSKFPPKNINALYGYRTSSSMKSQERWNFAQRYSAQEMIKLGALLVASSFIGFLTNFTPIINMTIGLSFLILVSIILIWRVEIALKQKFNKE